MRLNKYLLLSAVLLTACMVEPLQDHVTQQDIEIITSGGGMNVYNHGYDNMDRGHHEFDGIDIVVDQTYYKSNVVQRGEIVFYKNPKLENANLHLSENEISRIVALPGEKIRIDQGQIYINGRKLDTFYGQAHRLGVNMKELPTAADFLKDKEANVKEMKVPDEQYYIVGDDWFRSADSRHFGTISKDNILGKVLGVVKK